MSEPYLMAGDRMVGDGGNVTVYERPDGSCYALDTNGHGREWESGGAIFGRARFDSRELATGRWQGSRSASSKREVETPAAKRARRRRGG